MQRKHSVAFIASFLLMILIFFGQACELQKDLTGEFGDLGSFQDSPDKTEDVNIRTSIENLSTLKIYSEGAWIDFDVTGFEPTDRINFAGDSCSSLVQLSSNRFRCHYGVISSTSPSLRIVDESNRLVGVFEGKFQFVEDFTTIRTLVGLLDNTPTPQNNTPVNSAPAEGIGQNARFNQISGMAIDDSGANAYVADFNSHIIFKVNLEALDSSIQIGSLNQEGYEDGSDETALIGFPRDLAFHNGILYFVDGSTSLIRTWNESDGNVETFLGVDGELSQVDSQNISEARVENPSNLSIHQGHLYFADQNTLRRVNLENGAVETLVGQAGNAVDANTSSWTAQDNSVYQNFVPAQEIKSEGALYENNLNERIKVTLPESAGFVKIEFEYLDFETSYDFLIIEDENGNELERLTGNLGNYTTQAYRIDSQEFFLRIQTDNSVQRTGFKVTQIEFSKIDETELNLTHSLDLAAENSLIGNIESIAGHGDLIYFYDSVPGLLRLLNTTNGEVRTVFGNGRGNSDTTRGVINAPNLSQIGSVSDPGGSSLFVNNSSIYLTDRYWNRVIRINKEDFSANEWLFLDRNDIPNLIEADGDLSNSANAYAPEFIDFHPVQGMILSNQWNMRLIN